MSRRKNDKVLQEMNPALEPGSYVYVIWQGLVEEPERTIVVFDRYSKTQEPEDKGCFWVNERLELSPSNFNGKPVPAFTAKGRIIYPGEAIGFYVGKENIVRQLRSKGLESHADMVAKFL